MLRASVSVCIAAYNGESYIAKQIESILPQLFDNDEIIVVDDCSKDNTKGVIVKLDDPRIKLHSNNLNLGVVKTFERAIKLSSNEIVFLSDQDDEWKPGKIDIVLDYMQKYSQDMIIHDGIIVDESGTVIYDSIFNLRKSRKGVIKNLLKDTHMGSCMAFDRKIINNILPIPDNIGPVHDLWIGLISEILRYKVMFIPEKLILWKRHDYNVSSFKRRKLQIILYHRIKLMYHILSFLIMRMFR